METYIHEYLSKFFYLRDDKKHYGKYGVYYKEYDLFIYPKELLQELNIIFGIPENYCKDIVIRWVRYNKYYYFNEYLEWYWLQEKNVFDSFEFPVIQQVFARTIANDLVSVQPMSSPVGSLGYPDYVYKGKKKSKIKIFIERCLSYLKIISTFVTNKK